MKKLVIVTFKFGGLEVGGRRWNLFANELSNHFENLEVFTFLKLSNSGEEKVKVYSPKVNFMGAWSDHGGLFSRFVKKVFSAPMELYKKRKVARWVMDTKYVLSSMKYNETTFIISMPPSEVIEVAHFLINDGAEVWLDFRDPISEFCRGSYLSDEVYKAFTLARGSFHVSARLTKDFIKQLKMRTGLNETGHQAYTITNAVEARTIVSTVEQERTNEKYFVMLGTLYKGVQKEFILSANSSIKKLNEMTGEKYSIRCYTNIDSHYAKLTQSFDPNLLQFHPFVGTSELNSIIEKSCGGIIPLWPDRFDAYGTKFFSYLGNLKPFLVIQNNYKSGELYELLNENSSVAFADYNVPNITQGLLHIMKGSGASLSPLQEAFSTEKLTQKLADIMKL